MRAGNRVVAAAALVAVVTLLAISAWILASRPKLDDPSRGRPGEPTSTPLPVPAETNGGGAVALPL